MSIIVNSGSYDEIVGLIPAALDLLDARLLLLIISPIFKVAGSTGKTSGLGSGLPDKLYLLRL